jgi:hypothetical protein
MGTGETAGVGETGTGGFEESTVVDVDEASVGKAVVGETGVGETRPAGVGKTGAGETGTRSVENCAGAAGSCVGTLRNEGAASEAA